MNKAFTTALVIALIALESARAQALNGAIAGVITDPIGKTVQGAKVSVINQDTGLSRGLVTSEEGSYSAPALSSGVYEVAAEAEGFQTLRRVATVEAGTTTTVDFSMQIGSVTESVRVDSASPQIHYDSHQVGGVVTRGQIENLPLNGRGFLELAKLEPGVTGPARVSNNRTLVGVLGGGVQGFPRLGFTQITVDGGSVLFPANVGSSMNVSQEAVQEFQLSTVNFDVATSLTTNGSVNIVTRSGGNDLHGAGFFFFRDHNLAAYPGLRRDPSNPNPFFQRRQSGYQLGGPIKKERVFFFTNFERNGQRGVLAVQPGTPEFAFAGGIFPAPFRESQFTARFDWRPHPMHTVFARYTHDGTSSFGPNGPPPTPLPSNWTRLNNFVDQSLVGLTSVLSPTVVNDLRFSYFFNSSNEAPGGPQDCPGCLGLGSARIVIPDASITLGNPRILSFVGRRYQFSDGLTWQKSGHRLRFGFNWEQTAYGGFGIDTEPAELTLFSRRQVAQMNPAVPLPSSFSTLDDILRLPLKTFTTAVGPGATPQVGFIKERYLHLYRVYAADTWRANPRLTLNYGLAWSYEPGNLNPDLTKPTLLIPLLGVGGLNPPADRANRVSPSLGFAWTATRDGKTVVRGGAGKYDDPASSNSQNINYERRFLLPYGSVRSPIPGSSILWNGAPLNFVLPTSFTGADLLSILPGIRANLLSQRDPNNRSFAIREIDVQKTGQNLMDPFYVAPYSLHASLGVQREIARNLVVTADFVYRRFVHTTVVGVDYNRYNRLLNGVRTPVIPLCTATQGNDPSAGCSKGVITVDNTSGLARYQGLLLRVDKRFSKRIQFLGSYALASNTAANGPGASSFGVSGAAGPGVTGGGFNLDNWFENYGPVPYDQRHVLNLSGYVELPARFQASFNVSFYSRPPFWAYVGQVDFNGDGTVDDLLPGTHMSQFNRGLGKADLARLVESYNHAFALRKINGQTAPLLTLPTQYALDQGFLTQDLRVSRTFALRIERVRLTASGEVFNLLNVANLVQYGHNIANPATFGQPGARFDQAFGSGGPRAFQLALRVSF